MFIVKVRRLVISFLMNLYEKGNNLMKFELSVIENALKYYQINDTNYKNKCYKCIKDVNEIKDFNIKAEEIYIIY